MGPEVAAAGTAAGAGAAGSAISPGVAMALMGAGTAAQIMANREQARQQRNVLNRAFDKNESDTSSGVDKVVREAGSLTGSAQAGAMQAAQEAAAARTMSDLKGAGADIIDTAGGNGAVSDAFTQGKAAVTASEGARMSSIANELGKLRAAGQVQGDATLRRAALAEQLASVARSNQNRAQAAQVGASNIDRPLYGDIGQLAALVGSAYMPAGAGAGAEAAATPGAAEMVGTTGANYGEAVAPVATAGYGPYANAFGNMLLQRQQRRQAPQWSGR